MLNNLRSPVKPLSAKILSAISAAEFFFRKIYADIMYAYVCIVWNIYVDISINQRTNPYTLMHKVHIISFKLSLHQIAAIVKKLQCENTKSLKNSWVSTRGKTNIFLLHAIPGWKYICKYLMHNLQKSITEKARSRREVRCLILKRLK